MTPSALLELWRDRWAKPAISALFIPYRDSAFSKQLESFALSPAWRSTPWRWSMRMLSGLAALGVITLPLTPNAQIVFAFMVAAVVVYVRRFAGGVLVLTLASLSMVLSLRYILWRVGMTLPTSAGTLDFAWAFALFSAECFLWLGSALVVVQRLWPLYLTPHRIEAAPVVWPAVDVILWMEQPHLVNLQAQWKAIQALEWPAQRITCQAVCRQEATADIQAWAASQGLPLVHSTTQEQHPWGHALQLEGGLSAPFVWVVDVSGPPIDPLFLQNTLGWFENDPSLGLLHTPSHPWADLPPAPTSIPKLVLIDHRAHHALVRRSALAEIGDANYWAHSSAKAAMADRLGQPDWERAWLLVGTAPKKPGAASVTCVYHPENTRALQAHLLMDALQERLLFYRPLAHALWMLTPVSLLWLQTLPIQSTLLTLAAFLLPHWLMAQLAVAASDSRGRLTFSLLLRELVLPLHLLVRTTQSFVRTQCRHLVQRLRRRSGVRDPALPWGHWGVALAWIGVNTWACAHAFNALRHSPTPWYGSILCLLVLWAIWNAMQAISSLAVEKEGRLVDETRRQRQNVQAMVQWAGQRPVPCVTSNFPQTTLTLAWPESVQIPDRPQPAQLVFFSLFHGYHEYQFEGQVTLIQDNRLQLRLDPAFMESYQALASAIFSRDALWPRWLPARNADNMLPSRLRALLNILETAFYNLTVQTSLALWMQRLWKWLRSGKQHHV